MERAKRKEKCGKTKEKVGRLKRLGCGCVECGQWGGESGGGGGESGGRGGANGGRSGGAASLWAVVAAETAGSALLVTLTCFDASVTRDAPPLQRALTGGLIVALLVQCFDHISGAMMNPTVTLAAVMRGRVPALAGAAMFAAQVAGAALGAAALPLLAPPVAGASSHLATHCLTLPMQGLSPYKAVCIEGLAGGLLALANCASWDPRNRLLVGSWPLRIGLIVTALGLLAGQLTGASMNPARSFGPALCAGDFDKHWVYWVGPLSGSFLFSAAYGVVWGAPAGAACRADPSPSAPPAPPAPPAPRASPASLAPPARRTPPAPRGRHPPARDCLQPPAAPPDSELETLKGPPL